MTISYTGETVRKHDPDRFLLSMFAAPERREALWALYAFNHEIAKTRDVVTETQMGLIRLQWWRDAIAAIFERGEAPQGHVVLQDLFAAIRAHSLPREPFDMLVYAREFDLEDRPPAHMGGLLNYADFTGTPLLDLSLRILGQEDGDVKSVKSVATGFSLTGILRATPYFLPRRRCYLPEDRIPAVQSLYEGKEIEKLPLVVLDIVEEARRHLAVTTDGKYLRLHIALARMYLEQIVKANGDLFSPRLQVPPLMRELRLWWAQV